MSRRLDINEPKAGNTTEEKDNFSLETLVDNAKPVAGFINQINARLEQILFKLTGNDIQSDPFNGCEEVSDQIGSLSQLDTCTHRNLMATDDLSRSVRKLEDLL